MASVSATLQERRRFARAESGSRFRVDLVYPTRIPNVESVNAGGGGVCLRLQNALDVRSLVRLLMTPAAWRAHRVKRVECMGRVAWISQRLDLRNAPPFLFDVGIELIEPSPLVRQLVAPRGKPAAAGAADARSRRELTPATFQSRHYVPRLERGTRPQPPWHLVVSVDGSACFSGRYASRAKALSAWATFKRGQAQRASSADRVRS